VRTLSSREEATIMIGTHYERDTDEDTGVRLRVGEETPPCESPCPGCGAYYFAMHEEGCEYEQCPKCGGPLVDCGGHPMAQNPS
jgi:hypothetical protein